MATYSYDRRSKTAASTNLYAEWLDIVEKHEKEEAKDMEALVKKAVPYLKSVGYDLIVEDSYIGKKKSGSDGTRMTGQLVVREREENTVQATDGRKVSKWVDEATNLYGTAKLIKEGPDQGRNGEPLKTWLVDLDQN